MSRNSFAMMEAGWIPGDLGAFKKEGGKIKLYNGGGGSIPSNTSSSTTSIPTYAKPYVERMLGKAEAVSSAPYQAYGGQRIAEFDPMQQQAFQGAANLRPAQQLGAATQMTGMAGLGAMQAGQNYQNMATNPNATAAYMSPYIQNALAPQLDEQRRQAMITQSNIGGQAAQQGAFGGARHGIVEAQNNEALGRLQSQTYGTGMQNAFQNAQQAQQFGSTLGLQGLGQAGQMGAQLGQLGQTQFGQQKDIINAQANAGAQQQAQNQQQLSQQYQDFLTQRGYPQQQLSYFSDMLRGLPLSQTTQQQYTAAPSMTSQLAGLGTAAYGAYQMGKKEGGVIKMAEGGLVKLALHNMTK